MRPVMPRPSVENNSPPCRLRYVSTESRPLDIASSVLRAEEIRYGAPDYFLFRKRQSRESPLMKEQVLHSGIAEARRDQQHDDDEQATRQVGLGPQADEAADLCDHQAG